MIQFERWVTGSNTDAANVVAKALKHQERYVRTLSIKRVARKGGKGRPEFDQFVIEIQYGAQDRND